MDAREELNALRRIAELEAKASGGAAPSKDSEPLRIDIAGDVPIFAESAKANTITPPSGFELLSAKLADEKPSGSYYDETLNAWFSPTVAPLTGGDRFEPVTTVAGLTGAATRGFALPAAGAVAGAALGAPFAGVGAIPGAIAGAGAATLAGMVGDPIISGVNSFLGTNYTLPTEAMEDLLTQLGVAEPRTMAERIVQTTAAGAGAGAGGVALGKAVEAAATSPVTREVGRLLATTPGLQTLTGGTAAGAGSFAKEEGASAAGQIAATVAGGLIPSVPTIVKNLTGQAARQIAPIGAEIRQQAEPTVSESLRSIRATVGEKIDPASQQLIKRQIEQTPGSIDVVNFRVAGTQVLPDNLAADAIRQGWKDGTIASIKAATPKDRKAMLQMLNKFKMGEKSEVYRTLNRPADILGDTVQSRIDFLAQANKDSGQAINRIADGQLRGQRVDFDPAINTFIDDLDQLGVKVEIDANGVAKANLSGSDIQGDRQAQRVLNMVLERLSSGKAPDAYGIHTAKRFIDTQVDYGKRNLANPLTAQAERILKNLRRNLNQTLGDNFPEYKAANSKYSETKTALDDLQNAAGTKINFESQNAPKALGTAMRKLTSNYGTRANLIDALDQANQTATKYGMKLDDDIVNQLIFVNELDRMFGAAAQTSLKGEVASAKNIGVDIARGDLRQRAFDLLAEKAEDLRGVNKDNAVKAMENLLNRKAGQP